jgi:hypothetical protein
MHGECGLRSQQLQVFRHLLTRGRGNASECCVRGAKANPHRAGLPLDIGKVYAGRALSDPFCEVVFQREFLLFAGPSTPSHTNNFRPPLAKSKKARLTRSKGTTARRRGARSRSRRPGSRCRDIASDVSSKTAYRLISKGGGLPMSILVAQAAVPPSPLPRSLRLYAKASELCSRKPRRTPAI